MTAHRQVYLGPYARCSFTPKMRDVVVRSCTNRKCKDHGSQRDGQFCSICGHAIGKCTISQPSEPNRYEIVEDNLTELTGEELGEELDNVHYLGPNTSQTPRPFWIDESDVFHEDLTTLDRAAEIEWFKKHYAKDLAKLVKAYDKIEISWGLHQFFR